VDGNDKPKLSASLCAHKEALRCDVLLRSLLAEAFLNPIVAVLSGRQSGRRGLRESQWCARKLRAPVSSGPRCRSRGPIVEAVRAHRDIDASMVVYPNDSSHVATSTHQRGKAMEHERSPEGDLGPDRKRRRKVLSCMDCRRRKVQCDRALPICGRCEKAGKPCSYEDDSPAQQISSGQSTSWHSRQQSVTVSRDVWDDMFNKLLHQERVIERLQAAHASPATPATVSIATPQNHGASETPSGANDSAAKERILFRGKGFKTTFFGPSDPRSAMTLVSTVLLYLKACFTRFYSMTATPTICFVGFLHMKLTRLLPIECS